MSSPGKWRQPLVKSEPVSLYSLKNNKLLLNSLFPSLCFSSFLEQHIQD